jgi:hypothetical protein
LIRDVRAGIGTTEMERESYWSLLYRLCALAEQQKRELKEL